MRIAIWWTVLLLALAGCGASGGGASGDGDAPAAETPRIRAGIGIDGVGFVGDPGSSVRAQAYDRVESTALPGAVRYLFDDADGAPSRGVEVCDPPLDAVRAVRLYATTENAAFETLDGVGLSRSEAEVIAILGIPFADGRDAANGWWILRYEGPYPGSGLALVFDDSDRSRMSFLEAYGPLCP